MSPFDTWNPQKMNHTDSHNRQQSFNNYVFGNIQKCADSFQNTQTQTVSQLDKFMLRYGKQGIKLLQSKILLKFLNSP